MKKLIACLLSGLFALAAFTGCAGEADEKTITVGASPTPHAEILKVCQGILEKQGYTLNIKEFTDYVLPNTAVEDGEIDANYFQHITYMNDFNTEHNTHLVSVCAPHYEPFGIYPGKTKSLEELADGASVAVPNDVTNEARALLLLEVNGLIKLDPDAGLKATVRDITENPKSLDIKEIEAAQLPRSIQDVDIAAINGNYAIQAGLHAATDALAVEVSDSKAATAYVNVLAVKEGNQDKAAVKALAEALMSQEVKDYIAENYDGAVIALAE